MCAYRVQLPPSAFIMVVVITMVHHIWMVLAGSG
jgi:hypothetical protein